MSGEHLVGMVLGNRYEILEVIGVGGMATVYKAHCRLLNRYVAIKVLKDSLRYDEEILRRFKSESRSAASLSHPNIVGIYDVGEEDGINYIVMEYVDGITLKEYISAIGAIPWRKACEFAMQIGLALECAHENNIIHRDIKPHNILLTKDFNVKVADFGIARAVTSETMVTGGEALGSVRYISPEQARGGYVDARSDVYSLGIVLYEMLTGRVPFDGDNAVSIAMMKLSEEPTSCRIINPEIPAAVEAITMKAISKEQHARYQTALDMVSDLKTIIDGKPVSADDEGGEEHFSGRKREPKKKKKVSVKVIIATAVLAAVVLGIAVNRIMSLGVKEVEVPELLGMTLEEAVSYLGEQEIVLKIDEDHIKYETSDEYEEGQIMLQEPGAKQYMKQNKKIKITVSSGDKAGDIPVPQLTGKTYEEAEKELSALGLKAERIEEESDSADAGTVIRQSPSKGTKVTERSSVLLHVSSGKKEGKTVPYVVGESLSTARKLIAAEGLKISITEQISDKTPGTVLSQQPSEGEISAGGTVKVTVAIEENDEPAVSDAPTSTPTPAAHTPTPTPAAKKKQKTLTFQIPESAGDTVQVKVIANGKVIHDQPHSKSEGSFDIQVEASRDATVEVYFDGVLGAKRVVEF